MEKDGQRTPGPPVSKLGRSPTPRDFTPPRPTLLVSSFVIGPEEVIYVRPSSDRKEGDG